MKNKEILEAVLYYIDAHLDQTITLETLSRESGYSSYHFSRIFLWGIGVSVQQYIKSRKMAVAAYYLGLNMRVLDIALELGFETHSGFSKAFKKYYGVSPEQYRMYASAHYPKYPKLDLCERYIQGGLILEPKIIHQRKQMIAGIAKKTTHSDNQNSKEIPAMWQEYIREGGMEKLHAQDFVTSHDEYGICLPLDTETDTFEYVIGIAVQEDVPTHSYQTWSIPEADYAVFTVPQSTQETFVSNIQGTWNYIFNEWFPSSGYELDSVSYDYERYPIDDMNDQSLRCDIYIPIAKKVSS